jgi:hypothetical protein
MKTKQSAMKLSQIRLIILIVWNNKILEWDNEHNVLIDALFDFRPGFSTVDAVFV